MPDSLIDQLIQSFMKFPGIGPRQARRFVYYLLRSNHSTVENLIHQIKELKRGINQCQACQRYFPANGAKLTECQICRDLSRDATELLIVEKEIDLENVERSDTYHGYYFVLGGLIPILDKEPARRIRAQELETAIAARAKQGLQEIILALSANPEGDYTAQFIKKLISPFAAAHNLKITTLGRGLSTGTELEYSDADTLKNALKHRE